VLPLLLAVLAAVLAKPPVFRRVAFTAGVRTLHGRPPLGGISITRTNRTLNRSAQLLRYPWSCSTKADHVRLPATEVGAAQGSTKTRYTKLRNNPVDEMPELWN
jgi:hypothetical protein